MKRILILAFIFCAFLSQAQSNHESLKENWDNYNNLLVDLKMEEAMDMVHPGIFDIISKESMISMFEGLLDDEDLEMKFLGHEIRSIEEEIMHDKKTYYKFVYKQIMGMRFNESEDSVFASQELIMMGLQKQYGDKNVEFDEETKFYTITAQKNGIAMYAQDSKDWKFLTLEDGQKLLLEKFLPEVVIKYIYK